MQSQRISLTFLISSEDIMYTSRVTFNSFVFLVEAHFDWSEYVKARFSFRARARDCGNVCTFERVGDAVSGGKTFAEEGVVDSLLNRQEWYCVEFLSYFVRCDNATVSPNQSSIHNCE